MTSSRVLEGYLTEISARLPGPPRSCHRIVTELRSGLPATCRSVLSGRWQARPPACRRGIALVAVAVAIRASLT